MASSKKRFYSLCFCFAVFWGRGRGGKALTGTKKDHPLRKSLFSHDCTKVSGSNFRVHQGHLFYFHILMILEAVSPFISTLKSDFGIKWCE